MPVIKSLAEHYARPDWVRRINAMGDSVGGADKLIPLDAEALICAAVESTGGLSDFGDFDGDWHGVSSRSSRARVDRPKLHAVGRLMTRQELLRGLRTRLLMTHARNENPAIADEAIDSPAGHHRTAALGHLDPVRAARPRPERPCAAGLGGDAPGAVRRRKRCCRSWRDGRMRAGVLGRRATRIRRHPRAARGPARSSA